MSGDADNNVDAQFKDVINSLQLIVPDLKTLLTLLSGPLECLSLLPPKFRAYNTHPIEAGISDVRKHISALQRTLLVHIAPTWDTVLSENHADALLEQYFCPSAFSNALQISGEIALSAYSTIFSLPLTEYSMHLLERLSNEYPVDRLHTAVFSMKHLDVAERNIRWEDCIRNIVSVPSKVSNAFSMAGNVLPSLENKPYFDKLGIQTEQLVASISTCPSQDAFSSVVYLLTKFVNVGVFPPSPPVQRSQPSFFEATLPKIRSRLISDDSQIYSSCWSSLVLTIPSTLTLQSILTSLFATLSIVVPSTDSSPLRRATIKKEAQLLTGIVGNLSPQKDLLWETAVGLILGREWEESYARTFVCWLSGASNGAKIDFKVLGEFLENILDTWTSSVHIKHSLLSRHRYITSLLLITASYFPPSSEEILKLALSPAFIQGISSYISHLDQSVRRCGMLAGEVIAQLAGKKLDFDDWNGDDYGKPWTRALRQLLLSRDVDVALVDDEMREDGGIEVKTEEVIAPPTQEATAQHSPMYDSDDSITGYESLPSSRSVSPTPSELEEMQRDPTVNVGVKKVQRPVYLAQLGELLRSTGSKQSANEPHEADKIEMALSHAEELIRKKRSYGYELEENAVNLAYALLSLHNNFNLKDFEIKRQGALNALVACAPQKAAPALIEEFFKNQYSTDQRYVALNALAFGARELASLFVPSSAMPTFSSKTLPPLLHQKYLSTGPDEDQVARIADDLSRKAMEKQVPSAALGPNLVRERKLRLKNRPEISELSSTTFTSFSAKEVPTPSNEFLGYAAEFFIMPLINRFWLFMRDEHTREERTAHRNGRGRYHGAGTGLILSPIILSHLLRTLAILVNASQHAPEWLAIISPNTLEMSITLGTRPISNLEEQSLEAEEENDIAGGKSAGKDASVLTSALELTLIVLDGSLEIDGGHTLGLEHTATLLSAGEWAGKVFAGLERGFKTEGLGGENEDRLRRAAAGVLLKVDELTSRWRRSMLDTR